jgi:hypothetical protein
MCTDRAVIENADSIYVYLGIYGKKNAKGEEP